MKNLEYFFTTLLRTIMSTFRILKYSRFCSPLVGIKGDGPCFVLGNGPSLSKDLEGKIEYLNRQDLMVVNNFSKTELYLKLKPKYYVIADPCFWKENLSPGESGAIQETFSALIEKTSWPLTFFVPIQGAEKLAKITSSNANITLVKYNSTEASGFDWFTNLVYARNLAMPKAQTVLIPAIFLVVNMGYRKIKILGADHSWHRGLFVDKKNVLYHIDEHFYGSGPKVVDINDHVRSPKTIYLHDELMSAASALEAHHLLMRYARDVRCEIINSGSNSNIDAYPRSEIMTN